MAEPPRDGLPKLQAVARAAGVSVSTVSKVLNGRPDVAQATRRRVADLLVRAGYAEVGGRGGRGGRSGRAGGDGRGGRDAWRGGGRRGAAGNVIEVVVDWPDDAVTSKLLRAVCLEAYARGKSVVVTAVAPTAGRAHPPRGWLDAMDARGGESVISLLMEFSEAQLAYFDAHGVAACAVVMDERDLGRVAARYLLGLGHVRIAVVAGPGDRRVAQGCRDALAGGPRDTRPSAVVFAGEEVARAGCAAIAMTGLRVPGDVSVICCGVAADAMDPPVTTVVQPVEEMARAALDAVEAASGEHRNTAVVTVPPRLVERGSTAPPRPPGERDP